MTGFEGDTPYIEFAYRANHITDICGAHLTGENLSVAVTKLEKELGVRIADYSVFANSENSPPRLELFIEPDGPLPEDAISLGEEVLEKNLCETGWVYGYQRIAGGIGPAILRPLAKGTCMGLRLKKIANGASVNQLKVLRLIDKPEDLEFLKSKELRPPYDAEQF